MNQPSAVLSPTKEAPTRVRYGVLGFACSLSMITYLDRACFGSAAPHIRDSLELESVADLALAMTSFQIAYASFEIPTGWLGDIHGPKRTLTRIVLWWSFFTALTAWAGQSFFGLFTLTMTGLVIVRFLFGIGEAGAYPNITRALHNWLPLSERGLGQGAVWMAGRFMGGMTPFLLTILIGGTNPILRSLGISTEQPLLSWREAFIAFGVLGVIWCVLFTWWFRDQPDQKPSVNAGELAIIRQDRTDHGAGHANVPWGRLFSSPNLWALCLMYACAAYGWYFHMNYLPTFLEDRFGIAQNDLVGGLYKGGPLWLGAFACLFGGILTDRYVRKTGNLRWGRRLPGIVGHILCGLCWIMAPFAPTAFLFFLAVSFAAFFNDVTMGPSWACCQDIGKRYAAIVAGCMNTIGNLGGALATWVTGWILRSTLAQHATELGKPIKELTKAERIAGELPGYYFCMGTFAVAYFLAVLFWLRIDATDPFLEDA